MKRILILTVVTVLGLSTSAYASIDLKAAQDRTNSRLRSNAKVWLKEYGATGPRAASWVVKPCTLAGDNVASCEFRMYFRHGNKVFIRCHGFSKVNSDMTLVRPLDVACVGG